MVFVCLPCGRTFRFSRLTNNESNRRIAPDSAPEALGDGDAGDDDGLSDSLPDEDDHSDDALPATPANPEREDEDEDEDGDEEEGENEAGDDADAAAADATPPVRVAAVSLLFCTDIPSSFLLLHAIGNCMIMPC